MRKLNSRETHSLTHHHHPAVWKVGCVGYQEANKTIAAHHDMATPTLLVLRTVANHKVTWYILVRGTFIILSPPPTTLKTAHLRHSARDPHIDLKASQNPGEWQSLSAGHRQQKTPLAIFVAHTTSPNSPRMLRSLQLRQSVIALWLWFAHFMDEHKVQGTVLLLWTFTNNWESTALKLVGVRVRKHKASKSQSYLWWRISSGSLMGGTNSVISSV